MECKEDTYRLRERERKEVVTIILFYRMISIQ